MKLYRIAKNKYIEDLSGEGAKRYGGRWNHIGCRMLYCAPSLSLCMLELLVHADIRHLPNSFSSIEFEIPQASVPILVDRQVLRPSWRNNPPKEFTKDLGTEWINSLDSFAVCVPSAVLPSEIIVLLNPKHEDFNHLQIVRTEQLILDSRLY